jgi:hypothetical protein
MRKRYDDDDEVRDRETIRVSMMLMDHRPGYRDDEHATRAYRDFCRARDAELPPHPDFDASEKAYQNFKGSLGEAWKNPGRSSTPFTAPSEDVELAERVASILRLNRPEVTKSSAPLPGWTRGSDGAKDHRAVALAAYDAMVARLGEAWRTPVGDAPQPDLGSRPEEMRRPRSSSDPADPSAARTREREREKWLGADPDQLARDLEVKRRKIDAEHRQSLENAWRGSR